MNGSFDFSGAFNKAWDAYKQNFLLVVGASFVASILISLTLGILAGPILAGLLIMMLKLIDGRQSDAQFEDIFSRFDIFVTTFLLLLAWGAACYVVSAILILVPLIGYVAVVLLGLAFSVFMVFAILQVAEKNMDLSEASKSAFQMVKAEFWPLIGFSAVASIISSLGAIACGLGAIFTLPMLYLMMAAAYRGCSGTGMIDVTAETVEAAEETLGETVEEEPPPLNSEQGV